MVKKAKTAKAIVNRRARFDYDVKDTYFVGIQLTGAETKALRLGQGQLQGAFVTIKNNEIYLTNASITGSRTLPIPENEKDRSRKLLAKRKEITELIQAKAQGRVIIPLEILTSGRYIKIKIATGVGRKRYDKRAVLKARDENQRINRVIKQAKS